MCRCLSTVLAVSTVIMLLQGFLVNCSWRTCSKQQVTLSERSPHLTGHARADHWLHALVTVVRGSPPSKRDRGLPKVHTYIHNTHRSMNRKEREPTRARQPHDLFQLSTKTMTQKQQSMTIKATPLKKTQGKEHGYGKPLLPKRTADHIAKTAWYC